MKTVILGVDFNYLMELGYKAGYLYDAACIRRLIQRIADAGIDTIYWRVSACGQVTYQSKVRTVIGSWTPNNDGAKHSSVENLIVRQADPPAVAVEESHRRNLRIFGYTTLFDEYYPGLESEFAIRHPEYTWKHRVRDHRIPGLLSYAYPEVREHRLAEIKELLGYGFDGIYLDTARTHAGITPVVALPLTGGDPYREYGFNEPEVAEFKRRYGVDPTLSNPVDAPNAITDRDAWNQLRGEYLTQFLREVRDESNKTKAEVIAGFYSDGDCYLSPAGRRGRVPMGMFHHDYQTWVDENLVDGLVIITEHRRYGDADWTDHSAAQFESVIAKGKRVYVSAAAEARIDVMRDAPAKLPIKLEQTPDLFFEALGRGIRNCLSTSASGVCLYEAAYPEKFDATHHYWSRLGRILH